MNVIIFSEMATRMRMSGLCLVYVWFVGPPVLNLSIGLNMRVDIMCRYYD